MAKVIIENKDGSEQELETVPSYEEKPADAHKDSGLYSTLTDFLEDDKGDNKDDKEKGTKADAGGNADTSTDTDTKSEKTEDIKKLLDNTGDEKGTGDKGGDKGGENDTAGSNEDGSNGESDNKFDELDDKNIRSKAEELNISLLSKTKEIEKLTADLTTTQSQLQTLQKDGGGNPEAAEFLKGIRKDFAGTIEKYREKYSLPDNNTLLTQMGGGSTASRNARLKQYIQSELRPKIEKDFGLDEGTFKFDKEAAWDDPESSSYAFRKGLEVKEDEFDNADATLKVKEKETVDLIQARQKEDKKWYAEKYLDGNMEKVEEMMQILNAIPEKIAKGELKPEDHPLSLRYIMRGYNYEALSKIDTDKAIADLKAQLKDMGVTFPKGNDLPTDITTIKKAERSKDEKPIKIQLSEFSPMLTSVEDTLNN